MTHRPRWTESILALLVGYAAGALLSLPISKPAEVAAAAPAETAA